ncbi:hypothetical protein PsYK624_165320 [Phanerochaete sordida]|uniref:Uncharacterized protein n=1 Tax=Phanerochaete sordida TaxID=48140 RepID=A0A9P3GWN8_9APHY|nr:hypothetical protein PsYK624_165320 [Phanerochaete sordida]
MQARARPRATPAVPRSMRLRRYTYPGGSSCPPTTVCRRGWLSCSTARSLSAASGLRRRRWSVRRRSLSRRRGHCAQPRWCRR